MKNRPDFFIGHQNKTKGKKNPCYGCTTETGRSPTCHATCKRYIEWKTPDEPVKEVYVHKHSEKRSLMKINGGRI